MTNSAKGFLSFALVLLLVNGAHYLSNPPPAYKTTLPVYVNIELPESHVWDVEVLTETRRKLDFEDTIRYYAKAIQGKKRSSCEITRHKLLPTTELTGTRAPIVIAAEISRGQTIEGISIALSGDMTLEEIDAIVVSVGEKVTHFGERDLNGFTLDKDGNFALADSIRYAASGFSGGINRMGTFNDAVLFLAHPLTSPSVFLYAALIWVLAVFFMKREQGGLENMISGALSLKFDVSVKTEIIVVVALTVLAFLFRINGITRMSLFRDEMYAAIKGNPSKPLLFAFSDPGNPPVYYLLLRCWGSLFGWTELAGKTLSVVIGSLSVVTMWYYIRTLLGKKPALFAASFMTVSSYAIAWSHLLRTYSFLLTLTPLVLVFFLKYLRRQKMTDLVLYVLSCVVLVNSHYYGVFVVMSNFVLLIIHQKRTRAFSVRKNLSFLAANALVALSLLPFLLYMGIEGGLMNSGFNEMSVPSGKVARAVFYVFKITGYVFGFFSLNIALFAGFCLLCACLFFILFRKESNDTVPSKYRFAFWYSLGFCASVIFLAFSASIFRPMMKEKYFIVLYPSIIAILALFFYPIQGVSRKPVRVVVFALLLLGLSGDMYYPEESELFHETARYISLDNARYESFGVRELMNHEKRHDYIYNEYYSFYNGGMGDFEDVYLAGKKAPEVLYGHPFADGPIPDDMTHQAKINIRGRYVTKYYSSELLSGY